MAKKSKGTAKNTDRRAGASGAEVRDAKAAERRASDGASAKRSAAKPEDRAGGKARSRPAMKPPAASTAAAKGVRTPKRKETDARAGGPAPLAKSASSGAKVHKRKAAAQPARGGDKGDTKRAANAGRAGQATGSALAHARTLRLQLENRGGYIEVSWTELASPSGRGAREWESYYVPAKALEDASRSIREVLQDLQRLPWDVEAPGAPLAIAPAYAPVLVELIQAGGILHEAVFRADADTAGEAAKFRKWFDATVVSAPPGTWRIEVVHISYEETICPWALASVPLSRKEIEALDPKSPQDYANFWGARFNLCVRKLGETHASDEPDVDGDNIGLACVMELDETAIAQIEKSAYSDPGGALTINDHFGWDVARVEELAVSHKYKNIFWYISLRHDGGGFRLAARGGGGGEDRMRARKVLRAAELIDPIRRVAKIESSVRVVLMFLDGDAIVRKDRGADWLQKALDLGRSGLIAVEADIDNPRLRNFGWNIMACVLTSRLPLLEAVALARRTWWPLGLLYGVYCNPVHSRVTPPPEKDIKTVGDWLHKLTATAES